MKKTIKLLSVFAALLLGLVLLVGCGKVDTTTAKPTEAPTQAPTTTELETLAEEDAQGNKLYTVSFTADLDTTKVYYAWLWAEGVDGASYLLQAQDAKHLYTYAPDGLAKIIVVTFASGTTEFSWDTKEAQSDDLDLTDRAAAVDNGEAPVAELVAYTVTTTAEIPAGQVFGWFWGGAAGNGAAYAATVEGSTITIQAPADATGGLVVVINADATEFSWNDKVVQSDDLVWTDHASSFDAWK